MTNAVIDSIVSRSTTKYYDPAVPLSDDTGGRKPQRGRGFDNRIGAFGMGASTSDYFAE